MKSDRQQTTQWLLRSAERAVGYALVLSIAASLLTGCLSGSGASSAPVVSGILNPPAPPGKPGNLKVSWVANREKAVNSAGGGYRVYYSSTGKIDSTTPSVNVPFEANTTTTQLTGIPAGTYTVEVIAYSALNPTGGAGTPTTVVVQ